MGELDLPNPTSNPVDVWRRFLIAFSRLFLIPVPKDIRERSEVYDSWRKLLFDLLSSDRFDAEWSEVWGIWLSNRSTATAAELMLLELVAFTTYVERISGRPIASDAKYPESDSQLESLSFIPGIAREALGIGATVAGSLRDLLEMTPWGKALIKALEEAASLWKDFHSR